MELGAFSISLAVKELDRSRAFYEKLGFEMVGGDGEAWAIVRNSTTTIGLFQGMFDQNILTFNPGWDQAGENLDSFTDVRDLQRAMEAAGLELTRRADEQSEGPTSLTLIDPDGNAILVDQHR